MGRTTGFGLDLGKSAQVGAFKVGGPIPVLLVVVSNGVKTWVVVVGHRYFEEQ